MKALKTRKTHQNKRSSYIYEFVDGTKMVIETGENGVTEIDIKKLHQADDREVYNNIKNSRPKMTDEEKKQHNDWEEQSDWRMFDKNWNLSIDALESDDGCNDKSKLWHQAYNRQQEIEEVNPMIERLHEVVMMLTPDQQELYSLVYVEELPQVQIAEELGITKQALHSRLKKIHAKIEKLF